MSGLIFISLTALTAVFSYLHGRDAVSKGYMVGGLAMAGILSGASLAGWWGAIGLLISPLYWFMFRTGKQAKAELDYMGRVTDDIKHVLLSYLLPIGVCITLTIAGAIYAKSWLLLILPILCIASVGFIYLAAINFRNDDGEQEADNRWVVEIANGLCGGINISSVLISLTEVVK